MGPLRSQGLWSHIDFSPLWGPREGRGYVAILISPHYRDLEKRTTTPPKGKGREMSAIGESREWSDDSDVEQPRRRFAEYEEAPLRPKPTARDPSAQAKAWAKDIQAREQV